MLLEEIEISLLLRTLVVEVVEEEAGTSIEDDELLRLLEDAATSTLPGSFSFSDLSLPISPPTIPRRKPSSTTRSLAVFAVASFSSTRPDLSFSLSSSPFSLLRYGHNAGAPYSSANDNYGPPSGGPIGNSSIRFVLLASLFFPRFVLHRVEPLADLVPLALSSSSLPDDDPSLLPDDTTLDLFLLSIKVIFLLSTTTTTTEADLEDLLPSLLPTSEPATRLEDTTSEVQEDGERELEVVGTRTGTEEEEEEVEVALEEEGIEADSREEEEEGTEVLTVERIEVATVDPTTEEEEGSKGVRA